MARHKSRDAGSSERLGKMPTGIEGLDQITGGGLPRNQATLFAGGPGTGKTILALQTRVHGVREMSEPGIFVAFEENSRRIVANAGSFHWDLPRLEKNGLYFMDARLRPDQIKARDFDLLGILAALKTKADKIALGLGQKQHATKT